MSFLKRVGTILAKATQIVLGVGPLVVPHEQQGTVTLIADKLGEVMQVVIHAEAFGNVLGIPGPDKAKAVAPAVAQIILSSALVGDRKVEKPALFLEGSQELGGAVAKILNSLKPDVDTIDHG